MSHDILWTGDRNAEHSAHQLFVTMTKYPREIINKKQNRCTVAQGLRDPVTWPCCFGPMEGEHRGESCGRAKLTPLRT